MSGEKRENINAGVTSPQVTGMAPQGAPPRLPTHRYRAVHPISSALVARAVVRTV